MLRQPTVFRNKIDQIQSWINRTKEPTFETDGLMHLFRRLDLVFYKYIWLWSDCAEWTVQIQNQ